MRRIGPVVPLAGCAIAWLLGLWEAGRAGDAFTLVWFAAALLTSLAGLAVVIGRACVYRGGTWRAALVATGASFFGPLSAALLLHLPVRRSLREVPAQLRRRAEANLPAVARRPRRVLELLGVLIFHGFGALTWVAFLGFGSDYAGTDSQFNEALRFGAATWLVAALLIVWLWRFARSPWFWGIPFAWWLPSYLLMIAVVYD